MKKNTLIALATLLLGSGQAARSQSTERSTDPAEVTNGSEGGVSLDVDAIRQEVEALRVGEVAWRKIEWGTCLLEGVRSSREQNKPIILWVFIDRPIDDKRC